MGGINYGDRVETAKGRQGVVERIHERWSYGVFADVLFDDGGTAVCDTLYLKLVAAKPPSKYIGDDRWGR